MPGFKFKKTRRFGSPSGGAAKRKDAKPSGGERGVSKDPSYSKTVQDVPSEDLNLARKADAKEYERRSKKIAKLALHIHNNADGLLDLEESVDQALKESPQRFNVHEHDALYQAKRLNDLARGNDEVPNHPPHRGSSSDLKSKDVAELNLAIKAHDREYKRRVLEAANEALDYAHIEAEGTDGVVDYEDAADYVAKRDDRYEGLSVGDIAARAKKLEPKPLRRKLPALQRREKL